MDRLTGFTFDGVIIANQLYCGCWDMLSMFVNEMLTYPVCEVPKTDFCIILPQLTSTDQSALAIGYLIIGWLSVISQLAVS